MYFKPSFELKYILESLQITLTELHSAYPDFLYVAGGDFNCRLGAKCETPEEIFENTSLFVKRISLDSIINNRGVLLSEFMNDNSFTILNGRSVKDQPGQFTFCNSNGKSTVDQIWCSNASLSLIENFAVLNNEPVTSYHFPITVEITRNFIIPDTFISN